MDKHITIYNFGVFPVGKESMPTTAMTSNNTLLTLILIL